MQRYLQRTVILADGEFPTHPAPLAVLAAARRVVCCDGAAARLLAAGGEPDAIVGDLDGITPALRARYAARLVHDPDQQSNDLTKAFRYCLRQGWRDAVILGATGLREDHTLGNLSLLADYAAEAPETAMITDHGVLLSLPGSAKLPCRPGQQISIFSFDPAMAIDSRGLRYPLAGMRLRRWWQATLNEAVGESFELRFEGGPLLLFMCHEDAAARPGASPPAGEPLPVALTIAGSDSGGNAGIQADLRAFHALRVHGCTAIAALTAQNPDGVSGVQNAGAALLGLQLDAILGCYAVAALKTGMLASAELIAVTADRLAARPAIAKVVDPVMVASSGARLLADDAVATLRGRLLPLATAITPNLPEAEALLAARIGSGAEAAAAARALSARYACAVLLKGGHDPARPARDWLCLPPTREAGGRGRLFELSTPAIAAPLSTHGTGCTLSAAMAAALAKGRGLLAAAIEGKAFVYEAIRTGRRVGPRATVLGQPERLPVEDVMVEEVG
jgi:thiamine pyrophosphokinase